MDDNEFTLEGIDYVAVDSDKDINETCPNECCGTQSLASGYRACFCMPMCTPGLRQDGRNVIFVEKQ